MRYKAWFIKVLAPLPGPWAIFIVCLVDSTAEAVPMDPIFAVYVFNQPKRLLLYAIIGAVGGAIGSLIPFAIGYKGGEALIAKRIGKERFQRFHSFTERYGDLALIIPATMPPGFPFKAFILSAGVAEMKVPHFMLAIFAGRLIRFLALGMLTIRYGPEVVQITGSLFKHHPWVTSGVLVAIGLAIWLGVILVRRLRLAKAEGQRAA